MDLRRLGLLTLICLAALGCRRDPYMDAYFEMLNSEKRVLEDRLYELEYDHKQALKELEAYRSGEKKGSPQPEPEPEDTPGPTEIPEQIDSDDMDVQIPEIELPPGFESGHRLRPDKPAFRNASVSLPQQPAARRRRRVLSDEQLADAIISALDQKVDSLAINSRATGGADLNRAPGDDGIAVLIEPRNKHGRFVAVPAAMTIVLLDPALTGEAARIGRWDINQTEAEKAMRVGSLDRGMHLDLPWSGTRPRNDRLHLFVRYTCEDGRILETDQEIRIQPPGRIAQRWTPRSSPSPQRPARREEAVAKKDQPEAPKSDVVQAIAEEPVSTVVQASAEEPISVPDDPHPLSRTTTDGGDEPAERVSDLWKPER